MFRRRKHCDSKKADRLKQKRAGFFFKSPARYYLNLCEKYQLLGQATA